MLGIIIISLKFSMDRPGHARGGHLFFPENIARRVEYSFIPAAL